MECCIPQKPPIYISIPQTRMWVVWSGSVRWLAVAERWFEGIQRLRQQRQLFADGETLSIGAICALQNRVCARGNPTPATYCWRFEVSVGDWAATGFTAKTNRQHLKRSWAWIRRWLSALSVDLGECPVTGWSNWILREPGKDDMNAYCMGRKYYLNYGNTIPYSSFFLKQQHKRQYSPQEQPREVYSSFAPWAPWKTQVDH